MQLLFVQSKQQFICTAMHQIYLLPMHLLLAFKNRNASYDELAEELQYFICSPHILLPNNMFYLNQHKQSNILRTHWEWIWIDQPARILTERVPEFELWLLGQPAEIGLFPSSYVWAAKPSYFAIIWCVIQPESSRFYCKINNESWHKT